MDFSCQSQVLAKPFPAKPEYDQGDVDAGGSPEGRGCAIA